MDIITPKFPTISEPESEVLTGIQPAKPISFSTDGKRFHHNHQTVEAVVTYKECLKNHAAGIGGHALDGCGEFMPSQLFNLNDPSSLTCAACNCHRNFHRRDDSSLTSVIIPSIEFRPHNRHQLPPPLPLGIVRSSPDRTGHELNRGCIFSRPILNRNDNDDDNSISPPPISSSYMLLSLSGSRPKPGCEPGGRRGARRKRFRTKFSKFQKEKMLEFAEKIEWRMPKSEGGIVRTFCNEIGVDKNVFKVWMHNNKAPGRGGTGTGTGTGTGVRRVSCGGESDLGGAPISGSF